ncbi:hypothetical protein QTG54_010968 [Skeletonema marinoi]|uniref:Calmodulin n=1 Tax=Skeletonema marinoi TaxID=267567 RepID=A0AAD9D9X5_9STRA|nr:hypothetical protein QTG54_010968 [Skeletonema marinoi]
MPLCQGGFCSLVLPHDGDTTTNHGYTSVFQKQANSLSKGEKRLKRSRQRDRAIRLLQWVLTDEEYSTLEGSGDLVTLRVNDCKRDDDKEGYWVDEASIILARREHRPELARLAFAEFRSSLGGVGDCCGLDGDCAAGGGGYANANTVMEPCSSGNEGDVIVCNNCYNVYGSLRQARALLNRQERNDQEVEEDSADTFVPRETGQSSSELVSTPQIDAPSPSEKAAASEKATNCQMHTQSSTDPSRNDDDNPKPKKKKKKRSKRRKRNRKQLEENSKVHILVAESDEITSKLAKRLLEKEGYNVDCALNGADCIKAIETNIYSVMLINESLTGKDASVIGAWIRRREITENCQVKMRILVMVQKVLSIDYHAYQESDVDGFLPKPLEGSKLLPSVKKAVSQYTESVNEIDRIKAANAIAAEWAESEQEQQEAIPSQPKERPKSANKQKKLKSSSSTRKSKELYMGQRRGKDKKEDPITFESTFQYDENTSFPYAILHNCSGESDASEVPDDHKPPWCNLIVCQDVFDTYERFKIFFMPMVARYPGMKILLWNYPGQAFTSFADDANLNNKYHAECLSKLLSHLEGTGKGKFSLDDRFFFLAHGNGASIATYYAATYRSTNLKGLLLVNGLSYVDTHFASVFHDCRNVFSCSPESRPDLPVYFYARFLFSQSYLSKTTSSLALNIYTAIHNPITLDGRKRLCQGVLGHVDTRPFLKDIGSPIISIHGENSTLVRSTHASEYVKGRRNCTTIPNALRGGNRTTVVMMKGGHELFQEKKYQVFLLIEQILTGFHDKARSDSHSEYQFCLNEDPTTSATDSKTLYDVSSSIGTFEDKLINNIVKEGRGGEDSIQWDAYQEEIITGQQNQQHEGNLQNQSPSQTNTMKCQQKQMNEKREFDPNEFPEVKEYMAWRIRRHKKRLAAMEHSARIIQCALRCFMARTMMSRVKKEVAAIKIQKVARGIFGRDIYRMKQKELRAAIFVQRAIRGHRGRCVMYTKRLQRRAQINVAKMVRGIVVRRRFKAVLLRREGAATIIQRVWRMKVAITLRQFHRRRRDAATSIQKISRGIRGRKRAALERDKYIFSRSQSSGIEIGRQMLTEHKLHATKLQSELSLLNQEKVKLEKQMEFHLTEVRNFERNVTDLEKKMHDLCRYERDSVGVVGNESELREHKRRLDVEFSETLAKISDRKTKLEALEKKFGQLMRTQREKFGQLKNLEAKLAVLLDAQDSALDRIRKKQEERVETILSSPARSNESNLSAATKTHHYPSTPTQTANIPTMSHHRHHHQQQTQEQPIFSSRPLSMAHTPQHYSSKTSQPDSRLMTMTPSSQPYYSNSTHQPRPSMNSSGPTENDKVQAAKLIDSTETMMKFGFMSMSLTYFSSLNMMRAMQQVALNDPVEGAQYQSPTPNNNSNSMPRQGAASNQHGSAVSVESWSISDVSRWLTSISLSQYQSAFQEGAVDGSLLCELTDDDLRNTLGVEHRLHRKKLLFSIRCLKNYANEAQISQHQPFGNAQTQPQHFATSSGQSIQSVMSPNSTLYGGDEVVTRESNISRNRNEDYPNVSSPAAEKPNSVLDILTPSNRDKPGIPMCDINQLRAWVRHQKHENIRDALFHVADTPFHSRNLRLQFVEEVGTAYTDQYEREPFNLNRVDEHGNTLMHITAQTGNIRIGKLLVRKGANPNHQNKQGQTPGHFAVAYQFYEFASWLFDEKGGGANDLLTNVFDLGPYDGLE